MFYPLFIDLNEKQVLVIGGGKIGFHKAETLAKVGAAITLIAPARIPDWEVLAVRWREEKYENQSLDGYFMVIVATDDRLLNAEITAACQKQGILCDDTASGGGDLIFPAVVKEGGFTVALSSSGKTPFLTKKVKAEIRATLAPYNEEIIDLLAKTRTFIIEHYPTEKEALLHKLAQTPLTVIKEKGNPDEISHWLQRE